MDLPILSAAAGLGAALLALAQAPVEAASSAAAGLGALVGEGIYASAAPIDRYGVIPRADELDLDRLGRVAGIVTGPDGAAEAIVVAVGGLWGLGAQDVQVGMDRVHLLPGAEGARLVVDLSAAHAAPALRAADL